MYPATNRLHYIDPVQDITVDTDRVLVLGMANTYDDDLTNQIVDVKRQRYCDGFHIWHVTTSGSYVYGAPINPRPISQYEQVLGIINDDLFVVGAYADTASTAPEVVRINQSLRSDRLTLGGSNLPLQVHHAETWVRAAPWASRLMPRPTDGIGAAAVKARLAEALHKKRTAQAKVIVQMVMRDLEDDLEALTEDHAMPTPQFGAMVQATAFLPVPDRLSEEALEHVRSVLDKPNEAVISGHHAFARIDMTFMYPGDAENKEQVMAFNATSLSRRATEVMQAANLMVSNPKLTPALRRLSA